MLLCPFAGQDNFELQKLGLLGLLGNSPGHFWITVHISELQLLSALGMRNRTVLCAGFLVNVRRM